MAVGIGLYSGVGVALLVHLARLGMMKMVPEVAVKVPDCFGGVAQLGDLVGALVEVDLQVVP